MAYTNLKCYINKYTHAKKNSNVFKNLVKLEVDIINFRITIGRKALYFLSKTSDSDFLGRFSPFW